jgi:hypothetical protein
VSLSYRVRGPYFESCNCEAICPCRMVGEVMGGRSTYGVCYGVLCWGVDEGRVGDIDVGGLAVALVIRYDDDEPGSPWTIVLHVDERGDDSQRQALEDVFLGRLGGPRVGVLPWVRKASHLVDVRASPIELQPVGEGWRARIGRAAELQATRRFETDEPVACGIPGYDRVGYELYADELRVDDPPFAWELEGNCAYATTYEYASE